MYVESQEELQQSNPDWALNYSRVRLRLYLSVFNLCQSVAKQLL